MPSLNNCKDLEVCSQYPVNKYILNENGEVIKITLYKDPVNGLP